MWSATTRPQRAISIRVEAGDWNCTQPIPRQLSEGEMMGVVSSLQARIAELEAQLAATE